MPVHTPLHDNSHESTIPARILFMKQFCLSCLAVLCFLHIAFSQPVACKDSSFRKVYSTGNDTIKGLHHFSLPNNQTVITGAYKRAGGTSNEGWMMLAKEDGTPVKSIASEWQNGAKSLTWLQGIPAKNNEWVALGLLYKQFTYDGHELLITKRNSDLNIIWIHRYRLNTAVLGSLDELFIANQFLWEAENGDLILLLNGVLPGGLMSNFHMVVRINGADGSLMWTKTFIPVHQESLGYASGAFQKDNSLVITGYLDMPPITIGDLPAFYAMRLNWVDGSLQLLKRYRYNNGDFGSWSNSFDQYKGRKIIGGYEIYGEEYEQGHVEDREFVAVQLDENLEMTGSQSWGIDYVFADKEKSVADAAGNFWVLNRGGSGNTETHLSRYYRNSQHKRRRLNTVNNSEDWVDEQTGARIAFKPNGNTTVLMNYNNGGKPVTELMQLVPEDTLAGCTGVEVSAGMVEIPFKLIPDPTGWRTVLDNGLEELPVSLAEGVLSVTENAVCKVVVPVGAGALSLGSDAALCNKDTLVLTATPGLSGYTWPVNYHLQTLTSNTVKVYPDIDTAYVVQATSTRGCLATDTVRINVLDTPRQFLPADTAVCLGGSAILQSNTPFNSYQWSTGETGSFITVNKQGVYTLAVTDDNGCKGEAFTRVALKDCATYVYIPTGFTPDNNGKNDVFKPVVSGNLAGYYFAVYNRWGQCVFATSNPQYGWNGTFKNALQPIGTYTWYCRYRFEAGKEQTEKGTVVLIR